MSAQRDVSNRSCSGGAPRVLLSLAAVVGLLACLVPILRAAEPVPAPTGNPFQGRQLFQQKGCSGCHSVWGHGGSLGPEITVAVAGKTWDELVGDFWNHTPRMIDEVSRQGHPWPTLDTQEMADVLSYLYYLRLFDDPGDPVRGADTYARLQCVNCHALGGNGGRIGNPLDRFGVYPSPTPMAQAMWNAGPVMRQEQLRVGTPIPQFTGHEMADLQAYVRAQGRRSGREVALQPLPSPSRGADVYRAKRCGVCHDQGQGKVPDITRAALSRTASEITGLLWNHSYAMGAAMAARGVQFPQFTGNELSDLISYLYFRVVFAARKAIRSGGPPCSPRRAASSATRPTWAGRRISLKLVQRTDRADLASAMWNHAPQMHQLMAEKKAPFWPKFESGEMRDLAAYLRSLSTAH